MVNKGKKEKKKKKKKAQFIHRTVIASKKDHKKKEIKRHDTNSSNLHTTIHYNTLLRLVVPSGHQPALI